MPHVHCSTDEQSPLESTRRAQGWLVNMLNIESRFQIDVN